jgi:hypothetical protein
MNLIDTRATGCWPPELRFHILDHIRTKNVSPLEKFTDWEQFQSLTSNLISPRIEINSGAEADKAVRAFTASTASAYRLSTSKITLSKLNNALPGLEQLLRYELLEAVDSDPPERIRPCDLQKLLNTLKFKKVCGIDCIPNECLRHLPRRPLVHLTHLINHCIRLSHFPKSWKEAKVEALPKPGKDPKWPQNLHPISLLSSKGKVFEKVILEIVKRHIEERNLLNASQFGFRRHCNVWG